MTDNFNTYTPGLESPASHLQTITPSDTEDLPIVSRALNVSTTGQVRVTTISGTTQSVFVAAGITFPVRARRVWATGTTTTGIVAMS